MATVKVKILEPKGATNMALRAFKTTFLVAIDQEDAAENRDKQARPVTLEELKTYLGVALRLDFDTEDNGNDCGVQSIEVNIEGLTELSPQEVQSLYGKK